MSGALIQLVSKGVQDVYLNSEEGHSFFRMKFVRHTNISSNLLFNSTIDLYIGRQKIDSQHYDYYADIWPNYLADSYTKSHELTNKTNLSHKNFQPLHFFFCDHGAFLPLVSLANHQVEVKVNFDQTSLADHTESIRKINVYGNYIYLDKEERESLVKRQMDFVITQTQKIEYPLSNVYDNLTQSS